MSGSASTSSTEATTCAPTPTTDPSAAAWSSASAASPWWPNYDPRHNYYMPYYGGQQQQQGYGVSAGFPGGHVPFNAVASSSSAATATATATATTTATSTSTSTNKSESKTTTLWTPPVHSTASIRPNESEAGVGSMSKSPSVVASQAYGPPQSNGHAVPSVKEGSQYPPRGSFNANPALRANASHYGGYYSPHYMPFMRGTYQKNAPFAPRPMTRNCYSPYYNNGAQQHLGFNGQQQQQSMNNIITAPSTMASGPSFVGPQVYAKSSIAALPPVSTSSSSSNSGPLPPSTSSASSVAASGHSDNLSLHDESSQQSTLSQSSDRSDGRQTPKHNTSNSIAGTASSTTSSGYFNSSNNTQYQPYSSAHMAPPLYNPTVDFNASRDFSMWQQNRHPIAKSSGKSDGLGRLYEMDSHPDRRCFLDKLLFFMEQRGSPIQQCPTISKNPLDLFKLYIYTKERGGYAECSKSKTWKDIAAQLGIGASSSAAYTLKKHYGKTLLPFECHFDRGGIDPAPLLAIGEAPAKKKANKSIQNEPQSTSVQQQTQSMYQDSFPSVAPPPAVQSHVSSEAEMKRTYFMNQQQQLVNRSPSPSKLDYQSTTSNTCSPPSWGPYGIPYGPQNGNHPSSIPPERSAWRPDNHLRMNGPQNLASNRPPSPYAARSPQPSAKPMTSASFPGPAHRPPFNGGYPTWPSGAGMPRGPVEQHQWANNRTRAMGSWPHHDSVIYQSTPPGWYRPGMRPEWSNRPPMTRSLHSSLRRPELSFPPGSVESTQPLLNKRQRYTKLDVQPIDPWRLVMALKSGLLCESTWALDTLNILLFDDNAVFYFALSNLKGLLHPLLEHLVRLLKAVFDEGFFDDITGQNDNIFSPTPEYETARYGQRRGLKRTKNATSGIENVDGHENDDIDLSEPSRLLDSDLGDNTRIISGVNYTKRARYGSKQEVEFSDTKDIYHITNSFRDWDGKDCDDADSELWRLGTKVHTEHIILPFVPDPQRAVFLTESLKTSTENSSKKSNKGPKECQIPDMDIKKDVNFEPSATTKNHSLESKTKSLEEELKSEELLQFNNRESHSGDDGNGSILRQKGIELLNASLALRMKQDYQDKHDEEDEDDIEEDDEEAYCLQMRSESSENLDQRVLAIWVAIRNLSFVPGNEFELSRNTTLLRIASKILTIRQHSQSRRQSISDTSTETVTEQSSKTREALLENTLVLLANICGALDLRPFDETLIYPLLDGLLTWASSSSIVAQDAFNSVNPLSVVSPRRLALEALCKLCVHEHNVDLLLATPPFHRLRRLVRLLTRGLARHEDQVLREMSINLLHYLISADPSICEDEQQNVVNALVSFVEQAEQNALMIAQQHGVNALRDNPESMGTSLDMLRRAANTLSHLSRHKENLDSFVVVEERLLTLVMSQILDQGVASVLSNVLFEIGERPSRPTATTEKHLTTVKQSNSKLETLLDVTTKPFEEPSTDTSNVKEPLERTEAKGSEDESATMIIDASAGS